jgi:hypothetical protein
MAARAKNATHQFQQAGGFSFARELAFSFNILSLTAKSGSYCDAVKAAHKILQQLTKNTKKPLPVIGTYSATVFGFTLTRR